MAQSDDRPIKKYVKSVIQYSLHLKVFGNERKEKWPESIGFVFKELEKTVGGKKVSLSFKCFN